MNLFSSIGIYYFSLFVLVVTSQTSFIIDRFARESFVGSSVSFGDVNGDGFDDILIGAPYAYANDLYSAGQTYIIYGTTKTIPPSSFDLRNLNGTNGFTINGIATSDYTGYSGSIGGDMNGDGISDILIGAPYADSNGTGNTGQCYLIFGTYSPFSSQFNLSSLNGSNGFVMNGLTKDQNLGYSVSFGGDINGDGFDDIFIGSNVLFSNNKTGRCYIIFGRNTSFPSSFDLNILNGSNGFIINGIVNEQNPIIYGSIGGDINGDQFDDILIGNPYANDGAGQCYIIFGRNTSFPASINLGNFDDSNGFIINGIRADGDFGFAVSIGGDVNGDSLDDILIGARGVALIDGDSPQGQSYLIFGTNIPFPVSFNLSSLNGSNGFAINGISSNDMSGWSVSIGGDVNADGFDDVLISAPFAYNNDRRNAGQSYIIFGRNTLFPPSFNLSSLDGSNGFLVNGIAIDDAIGKKVSIGGDMNGDGCDDILIGAPDLYNSKTQGQAYFIYGRIASSSPTAFPPIINLSKFVNNFQIAQLQNITTETEQHFNFQIKNGRFVSLIGQPIDYSIDVSFPTSPSWLNISQNDLKFEGQIIHPGSFLITIVGENWNGTVYANFTLNVIPKQREYVIPLNNNQSFLIPVPDPSGGRYLFESQQTSGDPLPPFILYFPNSNLISVNTTNLGPQIVYVTIIGKDENGKEQVRYDYTLLIGDVIASTSISDSTDTENFSDSESTEPSSSSMLPVYTGTIFVVTLGVILLNI